MTVIVAWPKVGWPPGTAAGQADGSPRAPGPPTGLPVAGPAQRQHPGCCSQAGFRRRLSRVCAALLLLVRLRDVTNSWGPSGVAPLQLLQRRKWTLRPWRPGPQLTEVTSTGTLGFPSQYIKSTKVLMATPHGRRLRYHTPEQVSNQEVGRNLRILDPAN